MRAMVTGATAPLGRALVKALVADPDVEAVLATGLEDRAPDLPVDRKLTYVGRDLARSRQARELMNGPARELGIDSVFHGPLHRRATDVGERIHRINVESTRTLLDLAERHPTITRWVQRSFALVYRVSADVPVLIREDHPIRMGTRMPQWLRDRVEADVMVGMRMGMSQLKIAVLRYAEILAPDSGSQLYDYLRSRVCYRPLGYDPMLQLMTLDDGAEAARLALRSDAEGVFNVPGRDVLPLSEVIHRIGRVDVPVPGPALLPLYAARRWVLGTDFGYRLNAQRFHFSAVLDGTRAAEALGYEPTHWIDWTGIPTI
jgi:UDP-glucose 4-epimerase